MTRSRTEPGRTSKGEGLVTCVAVHLRGKRRPIYVSGDMETLLTHWRGAADRNARPLEWTVYERGGEVAINPAAIAFARPATEGEMWAQVEREHYAELLPWWELS
jgi:hypothetical protein